MIKIKHLINRQLLNVATPINISNIWNLGSRLCIILIIQLFTGILLSFHYINFRPLRFNYIYRIIFEINSSWLLRRAHANGARLFFILIFTHLARGLFYKSYLLTHVWGSGFSILLILILTRFVGYVLPWGQIRYWGATVIINFLSAVPIIGPILVKCIWGDYSVRFVTLNRLFRVHFLAPIILAILVLIHILILHSKGSNNPTITITNSNKILFQPIFIIKDNTTWIPITILFLVICLLIPNYTIDAENYTKANILVTPTHIKPEWYYLFAYAILRAVPNKLGGILALVARLIIIIILPFKTITSKHNKINKIIFWLFISFFILLSWLGAQVVEPPYIVLRIIFSSLYFLAAYIN